uniref:DC1 domain-containing protein n=1 Tax=Salix viminalis TaxID=40686 RepID=A0A6N2NJ08_SALVM
MQAGKPAFHVIHLCSCIMRSTSNNRKGIKIACINDKSRKPALRIMFTSSHPQNRIFTSIDFSCDLCKNPSSKGWFYRCSFCEFDTHIASAISNKKADPLPPPDHTLKRQIMEADRKIDYRSQSDELMQLIVQGVESDIERNGQEVVSTAVTGWDERLHRLRASRLKNQRD